MSIKGKIKTIESLSESIKEGRQSINNKRKTKVRNKRILDNYEILLRRELDTSPGQTIVTKSGLFIDYDPDLKKGKTKKYRQELVNPPFSEFYKLPDKDAMLPYLDKDFRVIYGNHVADMVFTKFKIKEDEDEEDGKPGFGNGIGKDWDGDVTKIPQNSMIQVTWSGLETEGDFEFQKYRSSGKAGPFSTIQKRYDDKFKGKDNDFKVVFYDDWDNASYAANKNYYYIVWSMADVLKRVDFSLPEEIDWRIYKSHEGLDAKVSSEHHHGGTEIIRGEYTAAKWMKAVGDGNMYNVYRFGYPLLHQFWRYDYQMVNGEKVKFIRYIPISHIKIWNKDDKDDIAYDGKFDELYTPPHKS